MKPTILQIDFSDRCKIQCLKSKLLNFRDDIKISYLVYYSDGSSDELQASTRRGGPDGSSDG